MKKFLVLFGAVVLAAFLTACGGNGETSEGSLPNDSAGQPADKTSEAEAVPSSEETGSACDISIDQIEYSVGEEISGGERDLFMQITNNSSYTICGFDLTYVEKSGITQEQKEAFYSEVKEKFKMDDDDIEALRKREISMHASAEKLIPAGEKIGKVHLYYYAGSFYMRSLEHYGLVDPDIATINYVKDGKIYTEYYDFRSGAYSLEDKTEDAYGWAKNSSLGDLISKPETEVCRVETDRDDSFWFEAFGCSSDYFDKYVEDCRTKGFTVDEYSHDGYFSADDANGNKITVTYHEDEESISVTIYAAD